MTFQPIINPLLLAILFFLFIVASLSFALKSFPSSKPLFWAWIRRSLVLVLIALSLFRPVLEKEQTVNVYTNNYDVYFVVDTTGSMGAEDWNSDGDTRLDGVKSDIGRIVDKYSGARYALLTFDASPVIRTPLTKDASALMSATNNMKPEITQYSKGSSISVANNLLTKTLKTAQKADPDRARIVFYFGDGEQTASEQPKSFEPSASYISGGEVYGYGTEKGGKMATENGYVITTQGDKYIMDTTQNPPVVALSKIDPKNLENIASQLKVKYDQRTSEKPIQLPAIDKSKTLSASDSNTTIAYDFTWIIAIFAYLTMLIEIIYIVRKIKETRIGANNG
jgi:Ca-activated chloride channel family protein